MGMAASQARLLSITARLSDNEANGQALSYAKQRLADQTEQINTDYNNALAATKLQVLTGFNGNIANYEDISYGLMTGFNTVACGKQYIVADLKGRILVTQAQADAFKAGNGDFNVFLAELGYSQADLTEDQRIANEIWSINISELNENDLIKVIDENDHEVFKAIKDILPTDSYSKHISEYKKATPVIDPETEEISYTYEAINVDKNTYGAYDSNQSTIKAKQEIHEAWDKYFRAVGKTFYDGEHEFENDEIVFGYNDFNSDYPLQLNGYATYNFPDSTGMPKPINYEGTTDEQRELYDYAMAITSQYYSGENYIKHNVTNVNGEDIITPQTNTNGDVIQITLKNANELDAGYLQYLKNIFDKMKTCGFFTQESESDTINNVTRYKNGTKSVSWFEQQLTEGKLFLQSYSATEKQFVSVTISEDNAIQEVEDERAIAQAESKYNQDLAALEKKDQMIDLELKKLDTEHNALQTEYEQVKRVIDKNVEKSFNVFS